MITLLRQLCALIQELIQLQRAELELRREEHRALRRRGWGPADRMSVREAAHWLGVSEARAEAWLIRRGLLHVWEMADGEVVRGVIVGEMSQATRDGQRRPSQAELEPDRGQRPPPAAQPRRIKRAAQQ